MCEESESVPEVERILLAGKDKYSVDIPWIRKEVKILIERNKKELIGSLG